MCENLETNFSVIRILVENHFSYFCFLLFFPHFVRKEDKRVYTQFYLSSVIHLLELYNYLNYTFKYLGFDTVISYDAKCLYIH